MPYLISVTALKLRVAEDITEHRKQSRRKQGAHLLVDPGAHGGDIVHEALGEPERDLVLRGLDAVGAVDHVAADVDAEVKPDRARLRRERVGCADQLAPLLHDALALPDHRDDGTGGDELDQACVGSHPG